MVPEHTDGPCTLEQFPTQLTTNTASKTRKKYSFDSIAIAPKRDQIFFPAEKNAMRNKCAVFFLFRSPAASLPQDSSLELSIGGRISASVAEIKRGRR